ncbi:MAG: hypothetical protein A2511_06810 [Deltaproteobacteria bacterium RIFOXYD12_FULL_50_9]|nr:MAG: hypothetical protein A2511_06810 [Deltaproteobacteria bacterium RIFOXYD12_FULL_50_9]
MNFIRLKDLFHDFPVFSLADIRVADAGFDRRRLSEWQEKGYIRKIIKGYYIFADTSLDEIRLYAIANRIYKPSYISLETAFSHYRLIPESVYAITSVATRRTYGFETPASRFLYRTITPKLFFGYFLLAGNVKMAALEKALLDYFYLNSSVQSKDDFAALRINRHELTNQLDRELLAVYLRRFASKVLAKRIGCFLNWVENA